MCVCVCEGGEGKVRDCDEATHNLDNFGMQIDEGRGEGGRGKRWATT